MSCPTASCRLRVAFEQDFVELLLADLFARLLAQRILAHLANPLAPVVEDGLKRSFAGPVADEAIRLTQLGVVRVHGDATQRLGAVGEQVGAGRLGGVVCHARRFVKGRANKTRRRAGAFHGCAAPAASL